MVLLLHGTDTFRLLRKFQQIKQQAEQKRAQIAEFDFDPQFTDDRQAKERLEEIQTTVSTPLLFEGSQFVVVRRLGEQNKTVLKKAGKILQACTDRTGVIMLFLEYQTLPKKHTLYSALHETFSLKEDHMNTLPVREGVRVIQQIVQTEFQQRIADQAARYLWEIYDADLFGVWYALHTLSNEHPEESVLTTDHIGPQFSSHKEEKIFELSRAVLEHNTKRGLAVLSSLEEQGEHGLAVHGFLISQMKKALLIKDLKARGKTDYHEVGGNPKGHAILERQAQHISFKDMYMNYMTLIEMEEQIKHGERDPYPTLREFVASLS